MNIDTHMKAHHEEDAKTVFGFWIYIMTDCLLFASLFATYAVMQGNTYGGPGAKELFSLPYALLETMVLLTSSFTAGLGMLFARENKKDLAIVWFSATLLLGLTFIGLELSEFGKLIAEGHDWTKSGFLSAFYTLVSTHGLHVLAGSVWMALLIGQIMMKGLTRTALRRLACLSLFWHFLDIVWIFIFTFVYLATAA